VQKWNRFRPYHKGDIPKIWGSLRPEDYREFETLGITDPQLVEDFTLGVPQKMTTWDTERGPVAVLGVTEGELPGVGCIWAIASTRARPRWRFAVRHTEDILKGMSEGYNILSNYKDTRNIDQINWLRRLGFTFIRTDENYGGSGVPFHQFVRITQ
jgi:hypothetical protein